MPGPGTWDRSQLSFHSNRSCSEVPSAGIITGRGKSCFPHRQERRASDTAESSRLLPSKPRLCFVISNRKRCKFRLRCFKTGLEALSLPRAGEGRGGWEGRRGSRRVGGKHGVGERTKRGLEGRVLFRPSLNLFTFLALFLPVTLSGLHGRSARSPDQSSPTARPHSGPSPSTGHSLLSHPGVLPPGLDSLHKRLPHLRVGSVSPHPTGRQAWCLDPQAP